MSDQLDKTLEYDMAASGRRQNELAQHVLELLQDNPDWYLMIMKMDGIQD